MSNEIDGEDLNPILDAIDAAEDIPDPLDGLVEKSAEDPGAAFTPEVLERLVALKSEDRAAFEAWRAKLKKAGCRVTALDEAIAARRAADRYTFFKMMSSQYAQKYGAIATHMAKPFADRTGSGGHIHFHLADSETDENVFLDESDPQGLGLSQLAYNFIGGIFAHAPALCAITSPTVNCYKRLQVGAELIGSDSVAAASEVVLTALAALEASLTADPDGFEAWAELARVRAHTGDVEAAMLVCRIGLERLPRANIARVWGNLLAAQNRLDAALVAYRLALDLPGFDIAAMQRLFALRTERQRDLWLDDLEDLPLAYSDTAVGLAWRAAALSAVGQRDAALAIMNPERQPRRIPFEPPAEFGGIDSFNRRLAAEVIADPPTTPDSADFQLNTTPRATSQPAWRALGVFIRAELERAALQPEWFGLEGARRPTMARLVSRGDLVKSKVSHPNTTC